MENIWEETPNIFHLKSNPILFIVQDGKKVLLKMSWILKPMPDFQKDSIH